MRTLVKYGIVALGLLVAGALAPRGAAAQIAGTDHDFSDPAKAGTLCVTCHSPHKSGSSALLWNHTLSANTLTFGAGAATYAGTTLPTNIGTWSGTSKNCLSCHDGSVAVGDVIGGTDWSTTNKITGTDVVGTNGNLSGNHPVAVPYPDQAGAVYNSAAITGRGFAHGRDRGAARRPAECHHLRGTAWVAQQRDRHPV